MVERRKSKVVRARHLHHGRCLLECLSADGSISRFSINTAGFDHGGKKKKQKGAPWDCAHCDSQFHNSFGILGVRGFGDLALPSRAFGLSFLLGVWPFFPSFSGLALPSYSCLALPTLGLPFLLEVWPFLLGGWPSLSFVLTLKEVSCGNTREPLTHKVIF